MNKDKNEELETIKELKSKFNSLNESKIIDQNQSSKEDIIKLNESPKLIFEDEEMSDSKSNFSKKEIKTVGVIGGFGFLGYKIVEELLEKDFIVKLGTSENTDTNNEFLMNNLIENFGEDKVSLDQLSSFKQTDFENFLKDVDAIIISAKNKQKYK